MARHVPARRCAVLVASLLLATPAGLGAASAQAASRSQPVRVGGDDGDACPSRVGSLSGSRGRGVAVRSGPGRAFPIVGRLASVRRQAVFVCDSARADTWTGIVYGPAVRAESCGVTRALAGERRRYGGPCRQGWVPSRSIAGTAD